MKTDIHPKYFQQAKITCSCGNVIISGSTKENLKTELCSKCHPFYTGQQKLVDTAGRVDKFQAQRKRTKELQELAEKRRTDKKKKPEAYVEKEVPQETIARAMGIQKPEGKWEAPLGDAPAEEVIKEEVKEAKNESAKAKKTAKKKPRAKAATKAPAKKKK